MKESSLQEYSPCSVCGVTHHHSVLALRGLLHFCPNCARGLAEDCAHRVEVRRKKGGLVLAAGVVLGLSLCAAGAYWGRAYLGSANPPSVAAVSPAKVVSSAISPTPLSSPATASAAPLPPSADPVNPVASEAATGAATALPTVKRGAGDPDSEAAPGASSRPVVDAGSVHLLYVTQAGTDASMGLESRVFVTKEAPNKESAQLVTKVGNDMQASFDEGLRYVRKLPRDWEKDYSIRLSFEDRATPKDGGSAGTGFTIAMLAAIQDIQLDTSVAVTGDLTIDGEVQPVGGVVEKLRGAIVGKCKITLIPERNAQDAVDLALLDGPSPLWETQIFSIGTINDALGMARKDRAENAQAAIARFNALRARLPAVVTPNFLRSPIVLTELKEVLKLAPNHLSAATLLQVAENRLPPQLTLNRSVDEILAASYLFVSDLISPKQKTATATSDHEKTISVFPEREFAQCMKKLNALTPILDRRSIDLKAACIEYASSLRAAATYKLDLSGQRTRWQWQQVAQREVGYQQQIKENYETAHSKLLLALRKLQTDGSLLSELLKK